MKTYFRDIKGTGLRVLYFYDTSIRLWTVFAVDADGNQIDKIPTQYGVKNELEALIDFVVYLAK